jgi:hypothetical protein
MRLCGYAVMRLHVDNRYFLSQTKLDRGDEYEK